MSKFNAFLSEKITRSDIQRTDRVSGVKSSEETLKNLPKGPEASIRRTIQELRRVGYRIPYGGAGHYTYCGLDRSTLSGL